MPKLFQIGEYIIFFWSNENGEPIHVHNCERKTVRICYKNLVDTIWRMCTC